jgi:hypothetical protein
MNALKETSLVTEMQFASILKAHTTVNAKSHTRGTGKRTAQVLSFVIKLFFAPHKQPQNSEIQYSL